LIGAIYQPATDELWSGGRGHPTTANGRPVPPLVEAALDRVSLVTYLHPGTLADGDVRDPILAAMSAAATVRMLGSGSVELASVASGRLGSWLQHSVPGWDWLPGAALVEAAGGHTDVLEHRGKRWHVAGNAQVVADVRDRLQSS